MLADGVSPSEILSDYPYLREADLRSALTFSLLPISSVSQEPQRSGPASDSRRSASGSAPP
jgi:hypothetical protein